MAFRAAYDALRREHLGTLMQLLGLAIQVGPKLERLAQDAIDGLKKHYGMDD